MKKTALITSLIIIIFIFLAPLIGNSFMKKLIDENIQALESNGLVIKKSTRDSGYLSTKEHFEFVLQNTDAFENYLSSYTRTTMPPAMNRVFKGATIAADIEYSNIPFSKAITMQIYPLTLSNELMQEMKINDPKAYKQFIDFLESKGILYHIEYNLMSEEFSGFIKDIDESYELKDNAKLLMKLKDAKFYGKGDLLAPKKLEFVVHTMNFNAQDGTNTLSLNINSLTSSSDFESFSKYTSSTKVFQIKLFMKGAQDNINIIIDNMNTTSLAGMKEKKVDLSSKSYIENLKFHSNKLDFTLKAFNSDIAVNALDKKSYEEFIALLTNAKTMNKTLLQQKLQSSLLELFSHGMQVKVSDISLQNITVDKVEELGGMKITSVLKVKEDKNLADKLKVSPMLLIGNIEMNVNIKLATALYLKIIEGSPVASAIVPYAKKDADSVYFDIRFKDAALTVNDKVVQ